MRGRRLVLACMIAAVSACSGVAVDRAERTSSRASRSADLPRDDDTALAGYRRRAPVVDPEAQRVWLRLRLGERRVYLLATGDPQTALASYPVAIGKPGYDTPTGHFTVTEKIVAPDFVLFDDWDHPTHVVHRFPPGPDNPLGVRWIGFAEAHGSAIGFHGTPHPELLGRAVSHGCVRMRNADVIALFDRVGPGTTVVVEP